MGKGLYTLSTDAIIVGLTTYIVYKGKATLITLKQLETSVKWKETPAGPA
jgi:hypothetical protein